MEVQRSVHLGRREHHDHGMHEVGAVGEPRQRVDEPQREELVDEGRRASAALHDDKAHRCRPGGVTETSIHRAHGNAQVVRVEAIDQRAHHQARDDPADYSAQLSTEGVDV